MVNSSRRPLPQLTDRIPLSGTGLYVSPLCLGITADENTVLTAWDLGVNFFFLSADLHWPLYEHTRRGLTRLFAERPGSRTDAVVAVVSYLSEPLFRALQFHEVTSAVRGLGHVDLLLAGAVSGDHDCGPRLAALAAARAGGHLGARSIGATFHSRPHALYCLASRALDIGFIRYNPRHPGAQRDVFPYLPSLGSTPLFGFKSTMFHVPTDFLERVSLTHWRPAITDHYRFALSAPRMQGILASPMTPTELIQIGDALAAGALLPEEQDYMIRLAALAFPPSLSMRAG